MRMEGSKDTTPGRCLWLDHRIALGGWVGAAEVTPYRMESCVHRSHSSQPGRPAKGETVGQCTGAVPAASGMLLLRLKEECGTPSGLENPSQLHSGDHRRCEQWLPGASQNGKLG